VVTHTAIAVSDMGAVAASEIIVGHCQPVSVCAADVILAKCTSIGASSRIPMLRSRRTGASRSKIFPESVVKKNIVPENEVTESTVNLTTPQDSEQGAGPERKPRGWTKGLSSSANEELRRGCSRGDLKLVKLALEAGAKVNMPQNTTRGTTPLMMAAASSGHNVGEVLMELKNRKADMNLRDSGGWSALLFACRNGKLEAAKFLLEHGADPTVVTTEYKNVLILSAMEGKVELVQYLLNNRLTGKQVNDADAFLWTAVCYAVSAGHAEIVRALLERGAKLSIEDFEGMAPLAIACQGPDLACVKLMCKKKADLNATDKRHRTALLHACLNMQESTAVWLVDKAGADPWIKDDEDNSALSLCDELKMYDFRSIIKKRWSDEKDNDA